VKPVDFDALALLLAGSAACRRVRAIQSGRAIVP
jgi:hypothetical protein